MEPNIELRFLVPVGLTSRDRTNSSTTSLDEGHPSTAACGYRPTSTDERTSPARGCVRNKSQARSSIDLESSLLPILPKDAKHEHHEPNRSRHVWFNSVSLRSGLYLMLSIIDEASRRVVKIEQRTESMLWTEEINNLDRLVRSPLESFVLSSHRSFVRPYQNHQAQPDWPFLRRISHRILYSVWTQPTILLLIVLQIAVLVQSAHHSAYNGTVAFSIHLTSWDAQCNLAIFSFYTVELLLKGVLHLFSRRDNTHSKPNLALRHIYNVLDVLAIVSFWINLIVMAITQYDGRMIQVLAMFSSLRILRLLHITPGTDYEITILYLGMKKSRTKLAKVGSFICFFWLFFAIIGVQAFKGSLRRSCVITDLSPNATPIVIGTTFESETQFCGGFVNDNNTVTFGYFLAGDGGLVYKIRGGHVCPREMRCQEFNNPYMDTVSFDNIFQSMELVFVTFSANTFSTLMYSLMDTEGLTAALFFAAVIVILYFWLLILLIGVIMGSIQAARVKPPVSEVIRDTASTQSNLNSRARKRKHLENPIRRLFGQMKWFWIGVIVFDLVAQAQRASDMSVKTMSFIDYSQTAVTWLLISEIILRFVLDWRAFHLSKQNLVDLLLALLTGSMQIGPFKRAGRVYTWFTVFAIARSYRIFWAVGSVRDLMVRSSATDCTVTY
jgi:hypothetical protein